MPPREDWLTVPGWAGYQVSSRGRVRSVERELPDGRTAGGVLLTPVVNEHGYLFVVLVDGKRRRKVHVARLVLEAFRGPWPPGMEALHRNGARRDCRLANLRWGTRPENRQDREKHKRQRAARRAVREVVTDEVVRETNEIGEAAPCLDKVVSPVAPP